jgi:hypothetical protein
MKTRKDSMTHVLTASRVLIAVLGIGLLAAVGWFMLG